MSDCIFCKIATGEIPCKKIWEDEKFLAFLDIHPATEGMTLVLPKKHLNSRVFENEEKDIHSLMSAAKKVSVILEKNLAIERVALVFEGIEINHLHLKLFPLRKSETLKMVLNDSSYAPSQEDLRKLALEIRR